MIKPAFQIKKETERADYGVFIIEPLEQGYGETLGNTLRRVLLTSLPGAAITQVKISGVRHKFSTLEGLKEDVIELILNLKQICLKYEGEKPVTLRLEKSGPGEVKAGDIKTPGVVEIVNKDLILGNLADKKSRMKVEMTVSPGWGYVPAEEQAIEKLGVIPLDATFSPIRRVNYRVEATRVGRRTDLDRLILEIFTDGTIKPGEALKKSAQVLIDFFTQVVKPKKLPVEKKTDKTPNEALKLTVEEINIPTRIANSLRKGGFGTVEDLMAVTPSDFAKVKNLGDKSIKIIKTALSARGISLEEGKK